MSGGINQVTLPNQLPTESQTSHSGTEQWSKSVHDLIKQQGDNECMDLGVSPGAGTMTPRPIASKPRPASYSVATGRARGVDCATCTRTPRHDRCTSPRFRTFSPTPPPSQLNATPRVSSAPRQRQAPVHRSTSPLYSWGMVGTSKAAQNVRDIEHMSTLYIAHEERRRLTQNQMV